MLKNKKTHNKYSLKYKQLNHTLKHGSFGIKTTSFGRLTETQFNVLYLAMLKKLRKITNKKQIRFWKPLLFNWTLTKLSSESRMGKGKGTIYAKAVYLQPGTILFEFDDIHEHQISQLFNYISKKTPLQIILIRRFL